MNIYGFHEFKDACFLGCESLQLPCPLRSLSLAILFSDRRKLRVARHADYFCGIPCALLPLLQLTSSLRFLSTIFVEHQLI